MFASRFTTIPTIPIIALILLAGCGGATMVDRPVTSLPGSSTSQSDVALAPITLQDTAPDQLELSIFITIGGYDVASRGQVQTMIGFTHTGKTVRFVAGEQITCGQLPVQAQNGLNWQVMVQPGQSLACTYTSGARAAPFQFVVPQAPQILSPVENMRLQRGPATPVTYQVNGPVFNVVALGATSKAFPPSSALGPTGTTIDTRTLNVGAGSIVLTQHLDTIGLVASSFTSASGRADAIVFVAVTWT